MAIMTPTTPLPMNPRQMRRQARIDARPQVGAQMPQRPMPNIPAQPMRPEVMPGTPLQVPMAGNPLEATPGRGMPVARPTPMAQVRPMGAPTMPGLSPEMLQYLAANGKV